MNLPYSLTAILNIILFNNKVNAPLILLILDILLILFFAIGWYNSYKRSNWKIDYWHITVLKIFVLPLLIMYPFSASIYNQGAVGEQNYEAIVSKVDHAFLIGVLGFIFLHLGSEFYLRSNAYLYLNRLFSPFTTLIENNIKSPVALLTATFISLSLMMVVLYIQISNDVLFNPRQYFMAHGAIRPIYNILLFIYPVTLTFFGIRLVQYFNLNYLVFFILLLIFSIFLGTRGAILEPILTFILFYYYKNHEVLKFKKLMFLGAGILFLAFFFQLLRNNLALSQNLASKFIDDFLYGNSFSDTRDFAWVLAYWDEKLLLGKTYLAGLLAFIPRQISEFRGEWNLGIFTTRTAGLNSEAHAGLRPGMFGESYFNFSYPGVIVIGFLFGLVIRHVDQFIKYSINYEQDVVKAFSHTFAVAVVVCLAISVNFMGLYTYLIFAFFLAGLRQFFNRLKNVKS